MGWIGVDLDGTLAHYDGWIGSDHIGKPVPRMVARVREWLQDGIEVRIVTARVCNNDEQGCRPFIEAWCLKHLGRKLVVTNEKDYGMYELWDDRAIQVIPNAGERVDGRD